MLCLLLTHFGRVRVSAAPRTVARQAPLSLGLFRQGCWNGLLYPPSGDLLDPGIKPATAALQANSFPLRPQGSPTVYHIREQSKVMKSFKTLEDEPRQSYSGTSGLPGLLWDVPGKPSGTCADQGRSRACAQITEDLVSKTGPVPSLTGAAGETGARPGPGLPRERGEHGQAQACPAPSPSLCSWTDAETQPSLNRSWKVPNTVTLTTNCLRLQNPHPKASQLRNQGWVPSLQGRIERLNEAYFSTSFNQVS